MIVQGRQQAGQYREDNRPAIGHASSMTIVQEQDVAGGEARFDLDALAVIGAGVVGGQPRLRPPGDEGDALAVRAPARLRVLVAAGGQPPRRAAQRTVSG